MQLHDRLRDLTEALGPQVLDDADGFRAALDDYLDEGAATVGDINLLVDAVRLDAVRRMVTMLDHGAAPAAAVDAAGQQLAHDRGSEDQRRPRWACAVLAYALGRVGPDEVARLQQPGTAAGGEAPPRPGRGPAPPQTAPSPRVGQPHRDADAPTLPGAGGPPAGGGRPVGGQVGRGAQVGGAPAGGGQPVGGQVGRAPHVGGGPVGDGHPGQAPDDLRGTAPLVTPRSPAPSPPLAPTRRTRRRTSGLVAAAAVVVLALIGGIGIWLAAGDEDGGSDDAGPTEPTGSGGEEVSIPEQSLLVGTDEDSGASRIIAIDVTTGEYEVLVEGGRDAVLPAISPDRSTVAYLQRGEDGATRPMILDVESGEQRRLLAQPDSPCRYSSRPAWSLAGDRLALICQDRAGDPGGLYVVDPDGALLQEVTTEGEPGGSPTWTSESTLVYIRTGATDADPTTLWEADLDTGASTPLTDGSHGFDSHPDWSEEAGLLLFSRHPTSDFYGALLVMERDGDIRPLTEQGESVAHPAWSPDGSEVVVTVLDGDREVIMVGPLDRSSGAPTEVPDVPGDPGPPAWGTR